MNLSFEISSAFEEIKVGLSHEEIRHEVASRAMERGAERTPEQLEEIATTYARTAEMLQAEGVVYAASCFGQFMDEWSTGTLTVGLSPLTYTDESVAVEGIRSIMSQERAQFAEISTLELPCGQAVLVIQQTPSLQIPGALTPGGQDIPIDVAQLQTFIPVPRKDLPGEQTLVTVTFSTPSVDHWPEYSEIVTNFLRTLRFLPDKPGEGSGVTPTLPPDQKYSQDVENHSQATRVKPEAQSAFG